MDSSTNAFDLLESALDQAFLVPPPLDTPQFAASSAGETVAPAPQPEAPSPPVEGQEGSSDDSWKAEYEVQVQNWRAQSAEAREKAEKERLKWEAIRAIEREEAAKRSAAGTAEQSVGTTSVSQSGVWESVEHFSATTTSTSFSSVSHSETSEQSASPSSGDVPPTTLPKAESQPDTATDESQKWEDVPSLTSSYPSLTFPDHTETPPANPKPDPQQPTSVTLAIFDSSLSPRTRLTALFSSLAINLLLPFVNGVMLGFGEIFAKNVVMQWFGWKPAGPASTVTNVGLRGTREDRQRQSR